MQGHTGKKKQSASPYFVYGVCINCSKRVREMSEERQDGLHFMQKAAGVVKTKQ